uniref:Uncharacterized protein n=1 Tax=Tanacetum cinerariifolium TaxID=118510 RepID=A0A699H096_TANCI|nr:hypothetical protein [Tanacetum cinerariifolium]
MVSDVGKHVVDPVLEHLDFMPSSATTLAKQVVEVRHVFWMNEIQNVVWRVRKILISKIWCCCSNPGGGFGNPGGGRETRGGADRFKGPGSCKKYKENGVEDDDYMVEVV